MSRRGSYLVAVGILLSRITGLVRQRVIAHFLGISGPADVLTAAFRIPNFLQNLFGEGALSASFIPAYARLLGEGKEQEARRLAGAVLALLSCTVAVIVLVGELATPWLVAILSPNWTGHQRELTIQLVKILFPGAGLLVLSAWCLGVLNSHRKFLLSYATPVVWNAAIVGAVLLFARSGDSEHFIVIAAWGSVVGSLLQILVQWPVVRQVGGNIVPVAWKHVVEVPAVIRSFLPNVVSRGANQISAFIDLSIATFLPVGSVIAIANAQVLYLLPVSLFGMAISAAELPEMSREVGNPEAVARALRSRLEVATRRMAFYVIPSAVGFLLLGDVIAAAVFQTGRFTEANSRFVWMILAGSATGLLASTLGRLYASAFFALRDTVTPLRYAIVRVILTGVLGVFGALMLPALLGIPRTWGAVGLSASAGVAGWIEYALLRRELRRRLGAFDVPRVELASLWFAALVAAVVSAASRLLIGRNHPILLAGLAVSANAIVYLLITAKWEIPEAVVLLRRATRAVRGGGIPT